VLTGGKAFDQKRVDSADMIIRVVRKLSGVTKEVRLLELEQLRAPQDRDLARAMVFRRLSLRDYIVRPLEVSIMAGVRVGSYPEGFPPPLDPILRDAVHRLFLAYDAQALRHEDLTSFVQLWFALTLNPAGRWKATAVGLEPGHRAQLAYAFGRRYVVLGRPSSAAAFFRDALEHLREGDVLHGFARDELERLTGTDQKPPAGNPAGAARSK
jgi:hypothetical protein